MSVYRRYAEFGKDINFNNDALAGRIADININPTTNNMTILSSYGTVYFNNIDAITVDGDLTFFDTPSVTIDNIKHYAVPTGTIIMYPSSTPPSGWLICNGQAVSRSTYALLYSYIGTTYGSGNGSTTFNLPDIRDRMVIHQDTSITRYNALNAKGGVNGVIFTEQNLPDHTHNYSGGSTNYIEFDSGWSHNHSYIGTADANRNGYSGWGSRGVKGYQDVNFINASGLQNHTHAASTSDVDIYTTGSILSSKTKVTATTAEKTFKNIQPSQFIYYIIKT